MSAYFLYPAKEINRDIEIFKKYSMFIHRKLQSVFDTIHLLIFAKDVTSMTQIGS